MFLFEFSRELLPSQKINSGKGGSFNLPCVVIALSELLSSRAQFLTVCE